MAYPTSRYARPCTSHVTETARPTAADQYKATPHSPHRRSFAPQQWIQTYLTVLESSNVSLQQTADSRATLSVILRVSQAQITTSATLARGGGCLWRRGADGRYHGIEESTYPLPNDEEEVERLDNLQFVCSSFVGGNVVAPISRRPTNICTTLCPHRC